MTMKLRNGQRKWSHKNPLSHSLRCSRIPHSLTLSTSSLDSRFVVRCFVQQPLFAIWKSSHHHSTIAGEYFNFYCLCCSICNDSTCHSSNVRLSIFRRWQWWCVVGHGVWYVRVLCLCTVLRHQQALAFDERAPHLNLIEIQLNERFYKMVRMACESASFKYELHYMDETPSKSHSVLYSDVTMWWQSNGRSFTHNKTCSSTISVTMYYRGCAMPRFPRWQWHRIESQRVFISIFSRAFFLSLLGLG